MNEILYVLTIGEYSDTELMGVFRDQNSACEAIEKVLDFFYSIEDDLQRPYLYGIDDDERPTINMVRSDGDEGVWTDRQPIKRASSTAPIDSRLPTTEQGTSFVIWEVPYGDVLSSFMTERWS